MSLPNERTSTCADATGPRITYSADGTLATTRLDVLTYNIEGLPFPARNNRAPFLREIGRRLAAFREQDEGPDIVVFQEAFTSAAARAIEDSGYRSIVSGPGARSRQAPNVDGALPGRRRLFRGEIRPNLTSSGLVIATDYPIINSNYQPFARGSCAGFDCLSNKGVLFAQIAIPGVPGAFDVFTTHMQSQGSSRVPVYRHSAAHARQAQELSAFAEATGDVANPTIVAGDFNMRNSDVRFYQFERGLPLDNVHRFCIAQPAACEVRQEWTYEDQWRRVQNLHFFLSGKTVRVRPVRAEGMFDGGPSGPVLSDHNGFRVIYEISWPTRGAPPPFCSGRELLGPAGESA
jgi:endonuclease/exonuclease/phosphatase family metal-dependent hydrolase